MSHESAVPFQTSRRIHLGLAVKSLGRSVAFYRTLFGQEPTKTRPGYAKFEVAEPPVNRVRSNPRTGALTRLYTSTCPSPRGTCRPRGSGPAPASAGPAA